VLTGTFDRQYTEYQFQLYLQERLRDGTPSINPFLLYAPQQTELKKLRSAANGIIAAASTLWEIMAEYEQIQFPAHDMGVVLERPLSTNEDRWHSLKSAILEIVDGLPIGKTTN
jgi:hypothetical protein